MTIGRYQRTNRYIPIIGQLLVHLYLLLRLWTLVINQLIFKKLINYIFQSIKTSVQIFK